MTKSKGKTQRQKGSTSIMPNPQKRKPYVSVKDQRRKNHFAAGGSQYSWNGGLAHTFTDRKKQASKNACRQWSDED